MPPLFYRIMSKLVRALDPKLERFRAPKKTIPYTPKSRRDLESILKRTPDNILSERQQLIFLTILSFKDFTARDLMQPKAKMTILHETDELSLFTLNHLFLTGAKTFPVLLKTGEIDGLIHSNVFDIEKVAENSTIDPYLDKDILFIRDDYPVEEIFSAFLRSEKNYALVIDDKKKLVGCLLLERLFAQLFDFKAGTDFCDDFNPDAVARGK